MFDELTHPKGLERKDLYISSRDKSIKNSFTVKPPWGDQSEQIVCKKCGSKEFHVAQSYCFTAIRCPNCKWEACIHEG